ncbi:hypothetical protein, partial [Ensifer sp. ENS01]|uniref:hypothetical protein n=1 Tax=Ensifer sp. ENS01 TaxID=2769293 RepID=UPI001AEF2FA4
MQVIGEGVAILSDSATVAMAVPRAMAASIGITPHANSTACQLAAFDEGERIAHKLTTRSTVRGSACRPDRASERRTGCVLPPASGKFLIDGDLAPKFYPVLSLLQRFWVAVLGAVAAGCGAEPFRLRSTASR